MATSTSPVRDDGRSPAAATSVAAATTASPSEPSADGTDSVRLHVRCSRFPKFTSEELSLALRELCGPDIQIRDVFKKKIWEFSFVEVGSVQEELLFREKLEGSKTFQGADVAVKRAERRKNDDEGAPKAKRRKKNAGGNAGPGADAVVDAVPRTEEDGFSQQRPDRNHLVFKHDVLPTLAELTNKLKTFGKQKNLSVVDRTAPLFKLYNYGAQKRIKHSHCKSTCKAVLKKVAGAAREDNKPIPGWADIERSGHGIGLEPLVGWPTSTSGVEQEDSAGAASPGEVDSSAVGQEDATTPLGYRNKMEMTLGQSALSPTDFEVGFVQRMDQNNEQQVGAPDDLPHIPATGKKLAKILREIVVESGLPVYRRHKEVRAGFWRIVMCRVSDLDVKQSGAHVLPVPDSQQPMQLVIQVTKFNHPTFLNTLIRLLRKHLVEGKNGGGCAEVGVKVESIYIQMNDGMSDAFELNGEVKEFYGDEGAGGSSLYTLLEDLKSGSASLSDEDVAQAEFLQGLRSNKYFNDGELFEKDLSPVARRGFVGNAGADAGEPTDAGVSADAVSADAVSADPDAVSADAPGVPAVDSIVTVTPTGNLLRPRTKNERKKGKNLNTNPEPALYHVFGKKEIDMHVCGLSFAVGPAAFFQTNSIVTQRLYEKALTWAVEPRLGLVDRTGRAGHFLGLVGEGGKKAMSVGSCGEEASSAISGESEPVLVLDVCSGVGTIGCVAARKLPHCQVVGVEIVPKAVESANGNAQRNGLQVYFSLLLSGGPCCHNMSAHARPVEVRLCIFSTRHITNVETLFVHCHALVVPIFIARSPTRIVSSWPAPPRLCYRRFSASCKFMEERNCPKFPVPPKRSRRLPASGVPFRL